MNSHAQSNPSLGNAAQDTPFFVRLAGLGDLEAIVAGNAAMARETEDRALPIERLRAGVARVLADATCSTYWVAERDGVIVGQLLVTREWSDWRNAWFWWIQSVYVAPAARRQGVYAALHRHIRVEAQRAGDVCGVRLYVERENGTAQRTYEALGMRTTCYLMYEEDWSGGAHE